MSDSRSEHSALDSSEGPHILVLDDDPASCDLVGEILSMHGYGVTCCTKSHDAIRMLRESTFDVFITDYRLGETDGLSVCAKVHDFAPGLPVIVLTGFCSVEAAIAALRLGVIDFVPKADEFEALTGAILASLQRTLDRQRIAIETKRLRGRLAENERLLRAGASDQTPAWGNSPGMQAARALAASAARCDAPVLIIGERGTEKARVAQAIHEMSSRRSGHFELVDCRALAQRRSVRTDVESEDELERMLHSADGGTLFLDNIDALALRWQSQVVNAISSATGSQRQSAARIVSASPMSLSHKVDGGAFRADLYYQLSTIEIALPPLRSRGDDIVSIAQHLLESLCGSPALKLSPDVASQLAQYSWPGNTDELERAIRRAMNLATGRQIELSDLPEAIRTAVPSPPAKVDSVPPTHSLEEIERLYISRVLTSVGGNKASAARVLGVDRTTLYRKLQRRGAP